MGYLYRPKLKSGNRASVDWIKYYVNGRPIRESTRTDDKEQAKRHLKQREGAAANGQPVLPRVDRITYQEVAKDLRTHYETTGCRDLDEADGRLAPLKAFFAGHWVARIGPAEAAAYAAKRQAAGAANATIHRELAVLIRMFRLAYERGKLFRLPVIRKLKEAGPRQGFFEREPYAAVRKHLAPDLQLATGIAYAFGWRMQSEVLTLELRQVDLDAGTLRQEPGTTKNDEGRLVYCPPDLKAQLAAQFDRVRTLERKTGRIIPSLFPHLRGPRKGQRRRDFRKTWAEACRLAGLPGRLRHDFQRTAVRNIVNAGVAERVAMKVTGHKTRAVFDRYHIVSPGDLQDVARKLTGTLGGGGG
ncbi:MAG: site-specific integrase [Candidatus Rokuibacteriota bacterium]|nr:MAG: site-specific integrase [Candidatus Rokubacteria bacterium]